MLSAKACLTCDAARVGELIGPQGATIKRFQAETGAKISFCLTPPDPLPA
jgi:hypothetical protein